MQKKKSGADNAGRLTAGELTKRLGGSGRNGWLIVEKVHQWKAAAAAFAAALTALWGWFGWAVVALVALDRKSVV